MGLLRRIGASLFGRDRLARELAEEQAFHIEERTRENLAAGMTPEAARLDARRRFGNSTLLQQRTADVRVVGWLDAVARESSHALRSLRRRPGLVGTAVLSLSLGIGATSAIFSVVDAALLKPLPIRDHDRVVVLREYRNGEPIGANAARFLDWRQQATRLTDLSGFYGEAAPLTGRGEPERVSVLRTFGPALDLIGGEVPLGRGFTAEEEEGRDGTVALLTHRFWQRRFGGDPAIVGQGITLAGTTYTVVGVLGPEFQYPEDQDVIIPAPLGFQTASRRGGNYFTMVGRVAPGASIASAQPEVETIVRRFAASYPETDSTLRAEVVSLQEAETAEAREPLFLLLGAVMLVLVIACVNIASLLLARAAERRHEAAIRVALGAGTGSLLRLYLIESGWLAVGGGLGGLLLAWLGVPLLQRLLPAELPRLGAATLDWRVTLFALLITSVCGLIFGLAPAWQASRARATQEALRDGGRTTTGGRRLARRSLVVVQVALSMILLVGAALLARSLQRMGSVAVGVSPERVLAVRLEFPWDTDQGRLHQFYRRALESFSAIPGVTAAGLADKLPLGGGSQSRPLRIRDAVGAASALPLEESISFRAVSDSYFTVVGAPLVQGRLWRDTEVELGRREVVVNQEFARRYLPPGRVVGALLTFDAKPDAAAETRWYEVVGVVADIRQRLNQPVQPPEVFISYRHTYWPIATLVLRGQGEPGSLATAAREAVRAIDPELIVEGIAPLELELSRASADSRVRTWLVGIFALSALLLAAVGLYGVLASDVAQRRQEIGVRMALGAEPRAVLWMMVRRGLVVTAVGLVAGGIGALVLGRLLASSLFGVAPTDPGAFLAAAATLGLVAFIASFLPARQAAALDPMVALRRE